MALLLFAGVTAFGRPAVAQTCTSFVNATDGDDSNPGSQILPWRSVEFAFESADAGETVCLAAGEYFYGDDADGIDFSIDGKSVDFVIRAFAGETEVRLSERFVRIDTGTGVVRFLAGTADELTLGRGLVNSDDPSEPDLLNFMHSLELVSGTMDVSDVSLTLGESVGNPDFVHPDNPDKTAPGDAAIRIDNGRLIGNPGWAPGSRTYIYASTGPIGDASIVLPAALAGSTLSFEQAATIEFPNALDARGARLQFGHSGAVVFESEVRLNAATTILEWTNGATGSVSFDGDVRVTSTQTAGGELVFSGPGDVYIARLLAEPALNGSHTARLVHDSGGLLRLARMETGPGPGSGPFELAFTQLSGTAELGDPGTTLNPPGPIENSGTMILRGDLSMGPAVSSLSNSGLLEIGVFDLILQESGTVVLNSGVIATGASGDGTVRVTDNAFVSGGGTLPSLRVEGGVLALDTQSIQGDIIVNSGGQLDLVTGAVLSVAGDVSLHTDPSFISANGSILMTGQDQSLSVLSGGTFPEFRLPDGDVTVTPGSSSLPAFTVEAGSLTADVDADLNVTGALRMTGGSAIIAAAGTVVFRDGAS
ncbi:MAG: hypothetical protein HKN17_05475, partial [Rhodothermales bacterium]|nr:hypothetical protein [Rhodothermales bacterium]